MEGATLPAAALVATGDGDAAVGCEGESLQIPDGAAAYPVGTHVVLPVCDFFYVGEPVALTCVAHPDARAGWQ